MEKASNRSLAYQLAMSISDKDLQNIAGGNSSFISCNRCIRISGNSLNNADALCDIIADM